MNEALQLFLLNGHTGKVVRVRGMVVEGDSTSKIYTSFDGSSWMEVQSADIVLRAPIPEFSKLNDSEEFVFLRKGASVDHCKMDIQTKIVGMPTSQTGCCSDTANHVCCDYVDDLGKPKCISWSDCRNVSGSAVDRDRCC